MPQPISNNLSASIRRLAAPVLGLAALALGPMLASTAPREPLSPQEAGDAAQEERLNPLTAFRESEQARLEEEIEGAWLLTSFDSDESAFDQRDFSGFALFSDGFMSLIFHGEEEVVSFLLGVETLHSVQAHVFRYRMSSRFTLQAAGMMGFSNFNEDNELRFDGADNISEFDVTLEDDELRLHRRDGRRFHFRRLKGGDFPRHAIEALRDTRGGLPYDE